MAGESRPKIFESGRDIFLSLSVLVVMMLVAVGPTGLCSINPEESDYAQSNPVDAATFLSLEARSEHYSVRDPQMPQNWIPNSARRAEVAGEDASVVGWVTAAKGFVQAAQTGVALDDAASHYDGQFRANERVLDVDGTQVRVLESDDKNVRPVWAFDLGDARVVLSGSADDGDFQAAVRAFLAATPIPANDGVKASTPDTASASSAAALSYSPVQTS